MGRGNGGGVGQNPLGDRLLSSSNHDSNADQKKKKKKSETKTTASALKQDQNTYD